MYGSGGGRDTIERRTYSTMLVQKFEAGCVDLWLLNRRSCAGDVPEKLKRYVLINTHCTLPLEVSWVSLGPVWNRIRG